MLEFDYGKLLLVGVVALLVIGPKDLPRVLRQVGAAIAKMRRLAAEFQGQFMDAMRDAEQQDLKKDILSIADDAKDALKKSVGFEPMASLKTEVERELAATGAPPVAPPGAPSVAPPVVSAASPPAPPQESDPLAPAGSAMGTPSGDQPTLAPTPDRYEGAPPGAEPPLAMGETDKPDPFAAFFAQGDKTPAVGPTAPSVDPLSDLRSMTAPPARYVMDDMMRTPMIGARPRAAPPAPSHDSETVTDAPVTHAASMDAVMDAAATGADGVTASAFETGQGSTPGAGSRQKRASRVRLARGRRLPARLQRKAERIEEAARTS